VLSDECNMVWMLELSTGLRGLDGRSLVFLGVGL
jgi:hypothetical protein